MTALDMTAYAEEMREIAADHQGGVGSLLQVYADLAEIHPGLSNEVRRCMAEIEGTRFNDRRSDDYRQMYRLGRLLGHVAPLEDQLNPERACPESPTGWHEWANNEQCCHCGKDVP